ncbi:TonB-dependent receptor [Prolixibacteraceae bacterium JC049]|nr:TonB-dependent receptor [Prolixibacteraceae bacterium JC049]
MKNNLLLVTMLLFVNIGFVFGQNTATKKKKPHKVKGLIVGARTQKPLEYANMLIISYDDSTTVAGSSSNSHGHFVIKNIPKGKYYLLAKYIGYKNRIIPNIILDEKNSELFLDPIMLLPHAENLKAIDINGEVSYVEFDADKRILKVTPQMIAQYPSASDLVVNLPSVTSALDGTVSLRGSKMFLVLIDNHPTMMDNQQALRALASNRIQKIELITTPGAKYDADGDVGIINFITKKDSKSSDFSGQLHTTTRTTGTATANLNMNLIKKKFSAFGGYSGNNRISKADMKGQYSENTDNDYKGEAEKYSMTNIGWLGTEFKLNKRTKLSLGTEIGNLRYDHNQSTDRAERKLLTERDTEYDLSVFKASLSHSFKKPRHQLSLYYQNNNQDGFNNSKIMNTVSDVRFSPIRQNNNVDQTSHLFQLDYALPLSKKASLSMGYHLTTTDRFKESYTYISDNSEHVAYDYDRTIHAGYTSLKYRLKKASLKLGLRAENVDRNLNLKSSTEKHNYNDFSLFPSIHYSRPLSKTINLQAGYSRRISRIAEKYLDPFKTYSNYYNQMEGNPNLKPSFVDSYELIFTKKIKRTQVILELFHRSSKDVMYNWHTIADNGTRLTSRTNAGKVNFTGVSLWSKANLMNGKLNLYPSVELYNNHRSAVMDSPSFNDFQYKFYLNGLWNFAKNSTIQVNPQYVGKRETNQGYIDPYFKLSVAFRQYFAKRKLLLVLTGNDILDTGVSKEIIRYKNETFKRTFDSRNRYLSLSLIYRFNNFKKSRNKLNKQVINDSEDF